MTDLDTIQKDLGIYIRDKLRADTTLLAFNSSVDAENWIFFGRPKDLADKFPVPRIIIEPIDEAEEDWNLEEEKDILIPYNTHIWIDQAIADAYDSYEMGDIVEKIMRSLDDDPDSEGIYKSEVIGFSSDPEPTDERVLIHVVVRHQMIWRQNE